MVDLTQASVAIVGGGLGGFTAAMAFAAKGAKVFLFERAAMFSEVGAGIQITPNGARVLRNLGLDHVMSHHGLGAQAVVPTDALSGSRLARFDLGSKTPPYRFIHRAALIDILASGAIETGVTIVLGAEVTEASPDGHISYIQDGQEKTYPSDLIVFADGVHSIGRRLVDVPSQPFFTGQVAWRALVTHAAAPVARIWMAPGRHVVTYPLKDGRLNIVGVQEREVWADEGWSHADDPENLRFAFADCCPELLGILAKVETTNLWGLFRHDVAQNWHKGRMCILGDAAHPTLPFLAQGANLAIEDAYVLAECCDAAESYDAGCARYQMLRKSRVARAIAAANANAANYHLRGPKRVVAHMGLRVLGKVSPGAFTKRLDWLYEHDVSFDV